MAVQPSDPSLPRKIQKLYPNTCQRILDAALNVFACKGFHTATIYEVAHAAGVGSGTIYLYFKNKNDLFICLLETQLQSFQADLHQRLLPREDPRHRLMHLIEHHLHWALKNPNLLLLWFREHRSPFESFRKTLQMHHAAYLAKWQDILQAGQHQSVFRPKSPLEILTPIFLGALEQACYTWLTTSDRDPQELDKIGQAILDVTLTTLNAST